MAMAPHYGVVYDIRTLAPLRIIDPGLDYHPSLGQVPAANPIYEALIDGTHPLGPFEAMALLPRSEGRGLGLLDLARKAILRRAGQ